jgi:hypothetical protein
MLNRTAFLTAGISTALALTGCIRAVDKSDEEAGHGRYAGVGIYTPTAAWSRLDVRAPPDPAAARLADDQAIIVSVDSRTGEIRSCGDLSGYCVGMNPWRAGLATSQAAPVAMTEHADRPLSVHKAPDGPDSAAAPADPSTH